MSVTIFVDVDYDRTLRFETVANHMNLARAILAGDEERARAEMLIISGHTLDISERVSEA